MADAKFSIGQINITDYLRVIGREVAKPSVEVYNQTFAAPHPAIRNFVITGLNSVTHYFDFYETSSTGSTGTLLATFTIDVGLINQSTIEIIEFKVGDTGAPANGAVNYINTTLDGIATTHLEVFQRSVGIRSWIDEITPYTGGGFTLLGGELFNQDDRWFINVIKDVTVASPSGSTKLYDAIINPTTSFTINSSHYNNLMLMAGDIGTKWDVITFNSVASIPNGTRFTINTMNTNSIGVKLFCVAGTIYFNTQLSGQEFYLRKNETVSLIVQGGGLYIYEGKGNWDKVGEQVFIETLNNTSNIDEYTIKEQGQWVNIEDEPRLFYFYVNRLPVNYIATDPYSYSEMNKWGIDFINNKFRMPNTIGSVNRALAINASFPGTYDIIQANTSAPVLSIIQTNRTFFNRIL